MEQSEQWEKKISDLGIKLVKQMSLSKRSDISARWMANYIAQLMNEIEICEDVEKKKSLQEECSDLILKLWQNKKFLPIDQPLLSLKPAIEILNDLSQRRYNFPLFREDGLNNDQLEITWREFANTVKYNTIDILEIVLLVNSLLGLQEISSGDNEMPLSEEEEAIVGLLSQIIDSKKSIYQIENEKNELGRFSTAKSLPLIFEKLEALLTHQQLELNKIKESLIPSPKK